MRVHVGFAMSASSCVRKRVDHLVGSLQIEGIRVTDAQRTVMAQIVGGQVDGAAKARELASKYRKMNKYSPSRLPTNA